MYIAHVCRSVRPFVVKLVLVITGERLYLHILQSSHCVHRESGHDDPYWDCVKWQGPGPGPGDLVIQKKVALP